MKVVRNKVTVQVALVTGGYGTGGIYMSAQIYSPNTGQVCFLPDMDVVRQLHNQDGTLACGGWSDSVSDSCSTFNSDSGLWNRSHTLPRKRQYSQSWTPQSGSGTYLIGGEANADTTDLVKPDGTVQQGFNLKYETRFKTDFNSLQLYY